MIDRDHIIRPMALAIAWAAWLFLMLALASFHPTDWPSHVAYPYPPIQNICGSVGAFRFPNWPWGIRLVRNAPPASDPASPRQA